MSKKFLVIVTVADEDTLKEIYKEGASMSAEELKDIDLMDMVDAELNWSVASGLSHSVIRELNDDEVDQINNNTWAADV